MSDSFGLTGLTVQTLPELISGLTAALQSIYGSDINLDSNSPDGELVNIFAQGGVDLREILVDINASFDPDQAEGVILDQRVGINGLKRNAGSFSTVSITVVTSQGLNLVGLDTQAGIVNPSVPGLFVIMDDALNLWYLIASQSPASAGTYTYEFQAAIMGPVDASPNTINTPQTIVSGVTSVNNAAAPDFIGSIQETDSALKVRRRQSVGITSVGFTQALKAALLAIPDVTVANVEENNTNTNPDSNGIPAHTIWCIVLGGTDAAIANAIYFKKSAGCGMKGSTSYAVTNPDGSTYTVYFDRPTTTNLYCKFTITLPGGSIDTSYLAAQIVANVIWAPGEDAVGDVVTVFLKSLNNNYRVTGMLLSPDGSTWTEIVTCPSLIDYFVMDVSRITIT